MGTRPLMVCFVLLLLPILFQIQAPCLRPLNPGLQCQLSNLYRVVVVAIDLKVRNNCRTVLYCKFLEGLQRILQQILQVTILRQIDLRRFQSRILLSWDRKTPIT